MKEINLENKEMVLMTIQEIMDDGRLWITLGDNEYYVPELLKQLKESEDNV